MNYGTITNCTTVGHGVRSEYQCRFGYQVLSEDIPNNSRTVKLQLEIRSINNTYQTYGYQQISTIDGTQLQPQTFDTRPANEWKIFGTRTITIVGEYHGSKIGSFTTDANIEWALKSGSANVTINLDRLHTLPVISNVSVVETKSSLTGYTSIAQFLSIKRFTITAEAFDGASISSYQVYYNNKLIGSSTTNIINVNFNDVGQLTTFKIGNDDYITLQFRVLDSMSTYGVKDENYKVDLYVKPNLVNTSSNIKRNGQITGKVKLNLVGSFYNKVLATHQNTISLQFKYWKKDTQEPSDANYNPIPFTPVSGNNNISIYNWNVAINGVEIEDVDKDFAYYFKIKATDYFGETNIITLLCTSGEYVWAEFKNRVDFKDITIQNSKIVESGNNSYGNWIKYADGTMICTGAATGTTTFTSFWNTFKRSPEGSSAISKNFPIPFVGIPIVNITYKHNHGQCAVGLSSATTNNFNFVILKPASVDTTEYEISYIAIGKWK